MNTLRRRLVRATQGGVLLAVLAVVVILLFRERFSERLLTRVLRVRGIDARLTVRSLGLDQVVLGPVRVGREADGPTLERMVVDYSLRGLLQRQIDSVEAGGVRVTGRCDRDGWAVSGYEVLNALLAGGGGAAWGVRHVRLEDAVLQLGSAADEAPSPALTVTDLRLTASATRAWEAEATCNVAAERLFPCLVNTASGGESAPLRVHARARFGETEPGTWDVEATLREEETHLDVELQGRFARSEEGPVQLELRFGLPDVAGLGARAGAWVAAGKPWAGWRVAGEMSGEARAQRSAGAWSGTAESKFHNGRVELPAFPLSVHGIEAVLNLRRLWPPETPEGQTLGFTSLVTGALALDGGEMVYQLRAPNTLSVRECSLLWCGGRLEFEPFEVDLSQPAVDIRMDARDVDLARVLALQQAVAGEAEGTAHGTLRFTYRTGEPPRVEGFLESEGAEKGRLRLANPAALTRQLDKGDPRIKDVEQSLRDFRYEQLRVDIEAGAQDLAHARLRLVGRSANNPGTPPVRLTVNFEAEVGDLLYIGSLLQRLRP